MLYNQLWIQVHDNDWSYLITTTFDDGIYAEWDTIEDALINFLDVFKTVKKLKGIDNMSLSKTEDSLFQLPVTV